MSEFPILVKRYTGDQARTLGCSAGCGYERRADGDEICQSEVHENCPRCGYALDWKYIEADPCPNCGTLGFYERTLNGCCSRVCMLQAEYKASLEAA